MDSETFNFDLEEGQRIVAMRANTSNFVEGRGARWRNLQFLVAENQ